MVTSAIERQQVYLAARKVFTGQKAGLRKISRIRKEVVANQGVFQSVVASLGQPKVLSTILNLLDQGVLTSDPATENEFPEQAGLALVPSPARSSGSSVGKGVTKVLSTDTIEVENVLYLDDGTCKESKEALKLVNNSEGVEKRVADRHVSAGNAVNAGPVGISLPLLHLTSVPIYAQHLLLTELQRGLEECCYSFAQKWLPEILQSKQYDCAMALELNRWAYLIRKHIRNIPHSAFNLKTGTARSILLGVVNLRHSAVHRVKQPARDLQMLVDAGAALASLLQDDEQAVVLERISSELEKNITSLELIEKERESQALEKLRDIQRRKQELDLEKELVIADMLEKDARSSSELGIFIEKSVEELLCSPLQRDHDGSSGAEDDEECYDSAEEFFDVDMSEGSNM